VRGRGTLVRLAEDRFVLLSPQEDRDWLFYAAALYGVACNDQCADGTLTLIGPIAPKILSAAGLEAALPPSSLVSVSWCGVEIKLARLGLGYEIWCDSDSAWIVWDRLMAAGREFALLPAGQAALDILNFESGHLIAGRDFLCARDGLGAQPTPQALGLCTIVDRTHIFNGKAGFLAAGRDTQLSGLLMGAQSFDPPKIVSYRGKVIGRVLSICYSPALQRTVGFAILSGSWPTGEVEAASLPCRVVALPFLPIGLSPQATEGAASPV